MAIEREDIERSDFTTVRRGYDTAAVDAHLREVAAEVERLQDQVEDLSSRPESLSKTANERLSRILEAAEQSAAEVRTEAGEEARLLIGDAQREAQAMTEEADRRARERDTESETTSAERLSRVDSRTGELMQRADALDAEFDHLLERIREAGVAAVETLRGDVEGLRGELGEMPGQSAPKSGLSTRTGSAPDDDLLEPAPETEPDDEPLGDEVIPEPQGGEPLPEPPEDSLVGSEDPDFETSAGDEEPTQTHSQPETGAADPDMEGARLIALNMALSGSSRAETAEYLRETFGFEDQALLDDVYDRVQAP